MHIYDIFSDLTNAPLVIFANHREEAVGLFIDWCLYTRGGAPLGLTIARRNPQDGTDSALQDALSTGKVGIGDYDPASGWAITAPHAARTDLGLDHDQVSPLLTVQFRDAAARVNGYEAKWFVNAEISQRVEPVSLEDETRGGGAEVPFISIRYSFQSTDYS